MATVYRPRTKQRSRGGSLIPLLLVAIGIHLLAAVVNEGFSDGEEYHRFLKQRNRAVFSLGSQTVPGLLPVAGFVVVWGAESAGIASPFLQATLLRVTSSLLGVLCALFVFSAFRGDCTSGAARRWLFLLLLFLWFLPPLQARFSAENWSGILFFLGLAWYYLNSEEGDVSTMVAGLLLGLAIFTRLETSIMLAGFVGWLVVVERADRRVFLGLAGGWAIGAVVSILADRFFYGSWTLTPWNALMSSTLGPWCASPGSWLHGIAEVVRRGFFPIGIVVLISALFFFVSWYRHVLTWVAAPYVLLYLLSPERELGDLFPLLPVVPVMMVLAFQTALETIPTHEWRRKTASALKWVAYPLFGLNLALTLGASLRPADEYAPLYRLVYDRYGGGQTILVHDGRDPYDRSGSAIAFYTPPSLSRMKDGEETRLDSILINHRNTRLILASCTEVPAGRPESDRIELREVFRSIPEWSALANGLRWFVPADTILLHEVSLRHGTPIARSARDPEDGR